MTGIVVATLALALLGQALFAQWLMVYTWDHPERLSSTRGPSRFLKPRVRFAVLLPARHEEAVIAETVRRVAAAHYPPGFLQIRVICHEDDEATALAARAAADDSDNANVSVVSFAGDRINKPRALNVGLASSTHEVVCVFDAEDDVHPDIFNVINTVMTDEGVGVVQSGVQLVNLRDHWFSLHNCVEYFYWYKSRLHFHAKVGMIPLGGNTVFLRRDLVERVDGWDENCLTEDADIGIRLSTLGESMRVVYDQEWVTREETPHSAAAVIRQRTRWHQGFIQVLAKGEWRGLPGWRRRALAILTLAQPLLDAVLIASLPLIVAAFLFLDLPVPIALLTSAPLYAVVLSVVTHTVGAHMFAREFDLVLPARTLLRLPMTYLPYQFLLSVGAVRAVVRYLAGRTNWEKTEHIGAHRPGAGPVEKPRLAVVREPQTAPTPLGKTFANSASAARLRAVARPLFKASDTPHRTRARQADE